MFAWLHDYRHRRYQRLLSEHVDGRLKGVVRDRLDAHLRACAACQEELESLRATVQALRSLPQAPVPRSFALREVPAPRPAPRARPLFLRSMQVSSAVAALLLTVLVVGDFAGLFPTAAPALSPTATTGPRPAAREELQGPTGPAGSPGPAVTPTPAPRAMATPTPMADVDTSLRAGSEFSVEDSGASEVWFAADEKAALFQPAEAQEPPRSAVATVLLTLKLALGTALAALVGATAYLTWRRRRQQLA